MPVGVEIKSNVGVDTKKSAGKPGKTKDAIKNSAQNKIAINTEIAVERAKRRPENSRSKLNTAIRHSRHERHNQRNENMPPIASKI